MNDQIKVHVVDYGREALYMRYRDPVTGKQVAKTTGTSKRKDAEREAARWESELRAGRYKPPSRVTWVEFRDRYEDEVLPGLAEKTATKVAATFNAVERIINPLKLASLTAERISYLQSELRKPRTILAVSETVDGVTKVVKPERTIPGLSESTIKGHMSHLLSALNWAHGIGLVNDVPKITMPQRAKGSKVMKGRPITGEEFDRLLAAVPKVLLPTKRQQLSESDWSPAERGLVQSWRDFLRGLWCSGLRLEESLELSWDAMDKPCVDFSGRFPMMRIPAESEKGNQDRLLPITPEFSNILTATPMIDRNGFVFAPQPKRTSAHRMTAESVGKIISRIGAKAGVIVNTAPGGRVKYASAHDLRRSFGDRLSRKVMPVDLQQFMRHESIETTLKYYVGRNAENTAAALWAAAGNASSNSGVSSATAVENASASTYDAATV